MPSRDPLVGDETNVFVQSMGGTSGVNELVAGRESEILVCFLHF